MRLPERGILRGYDELVVTVFDRLQGSMVIEHLHGLLEVMELFRVDSPDLLVSDALAHDQFVQLLSGWILRHVEQLGCRVRWRDTYQLGHF